jgi:membrane fusion protein (multidrug efflux system)
MKLQLGVTLTAIFLLSSVLGVIKATQISRAIAEHSRSGPPPESVTTTKISTVQWRESFDTVGSFVSIQGATLGAKESGNVVAVRFDSGARVKAGDVLLEIDRSVEEANLKGALARLEFAKQSLARAQNLRSQSAMSLSTFEDAQSKLRQAESEAQSIRATIERKTIVAPFDGRAGIRTVNIGSYVNAGDPIVPLYSLNPIYFNFSVPQHFAPLLATKIPISVSVDAFPDQKFTGEITAVNPNIDEATRTISIQATVQNAREEILPGMFGAVRLEVGPEQPLLAVPSTSVTYAPYGNSVYVVERSKDPAGRDLSTVRQQIVQLGRARGDFVSVIKGLSEGDEIVSAGTFKLRPGAVVHVQNSGGPSPAIAPNVENT